MLNWKLIISHVAVFAINSFSALPDPTKRYNITPSRLVCIIGIKIHRLNSLLDGFRVVWALLNCCCLGPPKYSPRFTNLKLCINLFPAFLAGG